MSRRAPVGIDRFMAGWTVGCCLGSGVRQEPHLVLNYTPDWLVDAAACSDVDVGGREVDGTSRQLLSFHLN